jgi:hypothetical protein
MSSSQVSLGQLQPWSQWGTYNAIQFAIKQALNKMQTATLVQVQACTNSGGLDAIGTVDVMPLVSQVDGNGNAWPHGTIYGIPYCRLVGGANAVIMDPQVGDIGVMVSASRDISKVVSTQAQALPGTGRKYHFSDSIYIGGCLQSAAPTQYVQFNSNGITVVSPQVVTVTAPSIQMGASGSTPIALVNNNFLTWFKTNIEPFLTGLGYSGPAPPADSVTTSVEGA